MRPPHGHYLGVISQASEEASTETHARITIRASFGAGTPPSPLQTEAQVACRTRAAPVQDVSEGRTVLLRCVPPSVRCPRAALAEHRMS